MNQAQVMVTVTILVYNIAASTKFRLTNGFNKLLLSTEHTYKLIKSTRTYTKLLPQNLELSMVLTNFNYLTLN